MPILFVTPVLLVGLLLSALAYAREHGTAADLTRQGLEQVSRRVASRMDILLDTPRRVNALNASLIRQGKLTTDDLSAWRLTLAAHLRAHPSLSGVVWGSADGRATWVSRYNGDDARIFYAVSSLDEPGTMDEYPIDSSGAIPSEPATSYSFDPRVRPWYRAPVEAGGAAWCEPFVWVGGEGADEPTVGISYGMPMHDAEGALLGVIDADLSLNDVSRFLEGVHVSDNGAVYVAEPGGLLVGSSRGVPLADARGERVLAGEVTDDWIRISAQTVVGRFGSFGDLGQTHVETVLVAGEPLLLMASPFVHATGLRWVIVTLVPERDFLAEVEAGRQRSMLVSAVACLLTLLLGWGAALLIIRPMIQLTRHARRVGGGELDLEIHLTQSPELRQLSSELNAMTDGLRDRVRMRHSLAVAMDVQQALLPAQTPSVTGLDVAARSEYCDETGGDYYDYLEVAGLDEGSMLFALGDVMGHGVAAAMLMATARGMLRSYTQGEGSLSAILTHVNDLLVEDTGGQRFMTMLLMMVDRKEHVLRWTSAGHDPPFYYDPKADCFLDMGEHGGLPLGIMSDEVYHEAIMRDLRAGQVIVIGTDGLWESRNAAGEQYGRERLQETIRGLIDRPASEIEKALYRSLKDFCGEQTIDDDVTFLVVKIEEAFFEDQDGGDRDPSAS
ncbi:SpoIIE family protein phosphatase [Mucisphaera calidilacus]|uniref:SpoIIE family protein phosphatase n=1 Tax=Mucisphaera calidilacus TaxID=2527982 RepID=UPI001F164786|nr:SpoIIE family protein phosphatase [Mucisphaera calidilacus]